MMNYQQLFTAHTETRQQARVGLPPITIPHLIVVRPIATAHTDWRAITLGRATANIANVMMTQIRHAVRSFKPAWSDAQQDHFVHGILFGENIQTGQGQVFASKTTTSREDAPSQRHSLTSSLLLHLHQSSSRCRSQVRTWNWRTLSGLHLRPPPVQHSRVGHLGLLERGESDPVVHLTRQV